MIQHLFVFYNYLYEKHLNTKIPALPCTIRNGRGFMIILLPLRMVLRPCSHYSVFVSIRFCCIEATVHTTPFSYKNGEKNFRFCAFTLICPITKTQRKTSVFVRSHYSVFVKLIVGYWSVFKNLRFCAFTLIKCVFKNLRFCGYPLLTAFSKTSVFVAFLCGSV